VFDFGQQTPVPVSCHYPEFPPDSGVADFFIFLGCKPEKKLVSGATDAVDSQGVAVAPPEIIELMPANPDHSQNVVLEALIRVSIEILEAIPKVPPAFQPCTLKSGFRFRGTRKFFRIVQSLPSAIPWNEAAASG
jgi:hypothetical protein